MQKHITSLISYSETLVNRIRERLSGLSNVEEKKMMGGLTFMYKDKMCVGIFKDELMCRIDPGPYETALEKPAAGLWTSQGVQ